MIQPGHSFQVLALPLFRPLCAAVQEVAATAVTEATEATGATEATEATEAMAVMAVTAVTAPRSLSQKTPWGVAGNTNVTHIKAQLIKRATLGWCTHSAQRWLVHVPLCRTVRASVRPTHPVPYCSAQSQYQTHILGQGQGLYRHLSHRHRHRHATMV